MARLGAWLDASRPALFAALTDCGGDGRTVLVVALRSSKGYGLWDGEHAHELIALFRDPDMPCSGCSRDSDMLGFLMQSDSAVTAELA